MYERFNLHYTLKRRGALLLFPLFLLTIPAINSNAQNDLKNWNSIQVDLGLTKKMELRVGHLRGFNITDGYSSDFNQSSIRLDYDFTRRFSLAAGAVLGSFSDADGANRGTLRATYKIPVADALSWSNAIQGEVHSSNEDRYRNRIVYITRLGTKHRLDFLRLSPSIAYSLYYNIGGEPIQYYDDNDVPAVEQAPNGFHRGRLSLNLNSRIADHLSFTLYYMMQREFNLGSNQYRDINVWDPVAGKTIRPFNDYNVIGATLTLDFDLYKKKKEGKTEDRQNN